MYVECNFLLLDSDVLIVLLQVLRLTDDSVHFSATYLNLSASDDCDCAAYKQIAVPDVADIKPQSVRPHLPRAMNLWI